ncbi:MAG TPA: APC family permease [Alphaproteobacteria bacterium]|nr:APC family permease [Alphaproteobacteria bacterium]
MGVSLLRLLVGRPLANRESAQAKLGALAGLPAMGLDGLASSAYGPEAALTILMPLGAAGLAYIEPILLTITAVLAVLYVSYRQTIRAYPINGGSYTVSKENLGINAGVLAATSLMIDYVLNVAVGISAGVAALVSAFPPLQPYTLWLCLGVLAVIAVANLRGTREAGVIFAVPTYLFLASFAVVLGLGAARTILAGGHPQPVVAPPALSGTTEAVSLWLLLRAFASGCTAMTGVEAVSNGVRAFREPTVKHAHRTLTAIVAILAVLLIGIAHLAAAYHIGAMDQTEPGYQSVLSQLVGAVLGRNAFYYVAICSLLAVLILSANTSFVDFPRLCSLVARDDFLPRSFATVGRRLVYSVGVLYLTAAAGLLLAVFRGVTDRLIPLFAIGAFLAFTLSQAGMAMHWRRALRRKDKAESGRPAATRARLLINAAGAVITGMSLLVILVAKFMEGAWITVLVIPCSILLLRSIRRYYLWVDRRLVVPDRIRLRRDEPPVVLIPTHGRDRLTDKALGFALLLSPDVIAVHLTELAGPDVDEHEQLLRQRWTFEVQKSAKAAGLRPPKLAFIHSPYRKFTEPLLKFLAGIEQDYPSRTIAVLIPELVMQRWWQHLLHSHRAWRLRMALLRYGGSRLVVMTMPLYLEEPSIEAAFTEKEDKAGAPTAGR